MIIAYVVVGRSHHLLDGLKTTGILPDWRLTGNSPATNIVSRVVGHVWSTVAKISESSVLFSVFDVFWGTQILGDTDLQKRLEPSSVHLFLGVRPGKTPKWIGPTSGNCGASIGETLSAAIVGLALAAVYVPLRTYGWWALFPSICVLLVGRFLLIQIRQFSKIERLAGRRIRRNKCVRCGCSIDTSPHVFCCDCDGQAAVI